MPDEKADDKQQILSHIHSIFQAFLDQDRENIRNAHTADWTGFLGPSTQIERGIEAYMANVEKSLNAFKGFGYELLDSEIQIYDSVAVVYYVARYDYRAEDDQTHSIPLRSVDIYRREKDGWIQAGSHITIIPEGGDWGEGDTKEG
ncbi:MAG: nuclear transport factor 2 family protein [candidate division Zixibacteria bacterium]